MVNLEDYRDIVGDEVISEIYKKARRLYGRHIVHINSTFTGGGVAEMLNSLVPLMNDIGIDTGWRILHGHLGFFNVTKNFHNALQGGSIELTDMMKHVYLEANENFSVFTHIDHDCVIVHDPQPLPFIKYYRKRQPWVWRCHIDFSTPNDLLWDYLKNFVLKYDLMLVSDEQYKCSGFPIEQRIIHPAIDPLFEKNSDMSIDEAEKILSDAKIPLDKPLFCQVSRFDIWKDPEGVIEIFKKVKEKVDCRLVLCGSMASDDPEGWEMYERVQKKAKDLVDRDEMVMVINADDIFVNALQRRSNVIVQKSLKEGFGLVVAEALWKGTPVVASCIGGIPLQIHDGVTGYLVDPQDNDAFANRISKLLKDEELSRSMGQKGKEHVRRNFLTTRLLKDYLDILNYLLDHCSTMLSGQSM